MKNAITVSGSKPLKKAFIEELGIIPPNMENSLSYPNLCFLRNGTNEVLGCRHTEEKFHFVLPEQWHEALEAYEALKSKNESGRFIMFTNGRNVTIKKDVITIHPENTETTIQQIQEDINTLERLPITFREFIFF